MVTIKLAIFPLYKVTGFIVKGRMCINAIVVVFEVITSKLIIGFVI